MMQQGTQEVHGFTPWPDEPNDDFLPRPRRANDLLAHWENLLYKQYHDAHPRKTLKADVQTFWNRLSTCSHITEWCTRKPSQEVHRLIVLLYFFSRIVERKNMPGVFGFESPRPLTDQAAITSIARRVSKKVSAWQEGIRRLPESYCFEEERQQLEQIFAAIVKRTQRDTQPQGTGPDELTFLDTSGDISVSVIPRSPSVGPPRRPSKKALNGGDTNAYLWLLLELVKAIHRGRDFVQVATEILHHFTPPAFQKHNKRFDQENYRLTVRQFIEKVRKQDTEQPIEKREPRLRYLLPWLDRPDVLALCPRPDFLSSSSVADTPRSQTLHP
jgi:hypothetical protein